MKFNLYNILLKKQQKKSRINLRLYNGPQRKGLVLRVVIRTPKKPNSAMRHVTKTTIYKNSRFVYGRIPGIGFVPTKYNRVLLRGGRANDLPTVRLTLIRNVYDLSGILNKKKRRSLYGTTRPEHFTSHIRRRYRAIYGLKKNIK